MAPSFKLTGLNREQNCDFTFYASRPGGGAREIAYLVAVLDWFSRYVLSWSLSTTLEANPGDTQEPDERQFS